MVYRMLLFGCLAAACACSATEYFVDSIGGRDDASGTNPTEAFRTLDAVARLALEPGDAVFLKRGCTFRGSLRFRGNGTGANPVRVGAYGEGNKPEILGSVILDGWQLHQPGVYKTTVPADRFVGKKCVYGVFEYDGPIPRKLVRDRESMTGQSGHFFFDEPTLTLYVATTDGRSPAEHRTEVSVLEQLVDLTDREWIVIEDLAFLFGNCRHIGVVNSRDITIRRCASLFVGSYGNPNVSLHQNTLRARIEDCFLYENVNCGVFISSGAAECVVSGCTIVKCESNDGVTLHSGGQDANGVRQGITGDRCVVENNVIGLCPEESIDITSGDYHVIRGNICYGNRNPGIIIGHDSDNILVENNICFRNARAGIHVAGSAEEGARGHNRIIRNLVYENGYPGLEIAAPYTQVLNNTVINSRERVAVRVASEATGSMLRNNIIATLDATIPHPSLHFIRCTPTSIEATLSNNVLFHAADVRKPEVFFPGGSLIRTDDGAFSVQTFADKYGTGTDSITGDPKFADLQDRLYLLSEGSPAVDAGTDLGLPYEGEAPDLGWREFGAQTETPQYPEHLIDGEDDEVEILRLWGKRVEE